MNVKKFLFQVFVSLLLLCPAYSWADSFRAIYPYNGQSDVYGSSSILISFTDPINASSLNVSLTSGGVAVPGSTTVSSDNLKATFTPSQPLMPGETYQVVLSGVVDQNGSPVTLPAVGLASVFTTGTWRVEAGNGVTVTNMNPAVDNFYDFSTLRVEFSEPVVQASVVYGSSFNFIDVTAGGTQVPGSLLVIGSHLVFQPNNTLTGGDQYEIVFTSGIKGLNGESMIPQTIDVSPIATSVAATLPFAISPDLNSAGGPGSLPTAGMVDQTLNSSTIYSKLIGTSDTYLSGIMTTELITGNNPNMISIVVPKGQVINISAIPVKLGGQISTGLNTGTISMTLLSNGTGYMIPNPYSAINPNASPFSTYLTLDICVTSQNGLANSIVNQDFMDLQLYGETTVDASGNLLLNAIGEIEMNIMGTEKAPVVIAMQLAVSPTNPLVDNTPPVVSSVYPSNTDIGVNSPVVVVFSKPINLSSLAGNLNVKGPNGNIAGSLRTDGSSVIFTPASLLAQNTQYTVSVNPGIQDVNGNTLITGSTTVFTTAPLNTSSPEATMVSSINPGVPCILSRGKCSPFDSVAFGTFLLPSNQNIEVYFTKPINPATINQSTFSVIDVNTNKQVPGSRIISYNQVTFVPNTPWIPGEHYQLTLVSGPDGRNICGTGVICGTDGLPLNTDIINDSMNSWRETPGGPNMVIPFVGGAYSPNAELGLSMYRTTDTNSNGIVDSTETRYAENSTKMTPSIPIASINDKSYLSGTMLSTIGAFNTSNNSLPLVLSAGNWIFGTSTNLTIWILFFPISLSTNRVTIRPNGPATGYISSPASTDSDQRPILNVTLTSWINVENGLVELLLQKSPVTMKLTGRITFLSDGRMEATLTNTNKISLSATLLALTMNPGDVNIQIASLPIKLLSLY
jgi:hypothetical protein